MSMTKTARLDTAPGGGTGTAARGRLGPAAAITIKGAAR